LASVPPSGREASTIEVVPVEGSTALFLGFGQHVGRQGVFVSLRVRQLALISGDDRPDLDLDGAQEGILIQNFREGGARETNGDLFGVHHECPPLFDRSRYLECFLRFHRHGGSPFCLFLGVELMQTSTLTRALANHKKRMP